MAHRSLLPTYGSGLVEAGCDEAGRGCLAGSVFAAAVILPPDYDCPLLNDSKRLTAHQRQSLRERIETEALAWAVGVATPADIDRINILHASFLAMHRAVAQLTVSPQFLLIDGPRFDPYTPAGAQQALPHACIVKGDGKYQSIAAASILAKTHRDEYMERLAQEYPGYGWEDNKGYPTAQHRAAIQALGPTPLHRRSFRWVNPVQLELPFGPPAETT